MEDKKTQINNNIKGKTFKKNPIPGTKFTIAISSAKGGVGKSTFATNLALALKKIGCKVGLLDADIYGPSLPKLFSINKKPESDGKTLTPINKYEIQCMSIGFLTDKQTPMIGYIPGQMPWFLGKKLIECGATIVNKKADKSTCIDRRLITGASPLAANVDAFRKSRRSIWTTFIFLLSIVYVVYLCVSHFEHMVSFYSLFYPSFKSFTLVE